MSRKYSDSAYRVAAMKRYEGEDELIEVDRCTAAGQSAALVIDDENNASAPGAWVKAWLWVSDEDAAAEEDV